MIGALITAEVRPGEPEADSLVLRVFGITSSGVLQVGLTDLYLQ